MTQQRPGSPGQDEAGQGEGGDDIDRDARLQALLRVNIAVPDDDLATGTLTGRRNRRGSATEPTDPADPADPVDPTEAVDVVEAEVRPPVSPDTGAPASEPDVAEPGATPPEARQTSAPVSVGTVLSVLVLLGLFATGIGLTYVGTRIIRSSTEGEVREPVSDPTAPGFEAIVEPTPTLVLVHDLDGEVDSITVLSLPNPESGGGGVVFVPTRVIADMPIFGIAPIEAAYDLGTAQVQAEVVGDLLVAGMGEVAVVDADRWAGLVAPVAPLAIDNPDDLEVDGEVRFPAGDLELGAEDVGPYLEARVEGESDLARLFRHETFWRAWLEAVAAAGGADAVPGELESGVGRFVRDLARGRTVLETLPVEESSSEEFGEEPTFAADVEGIAAVVAELIPFPRTPRPGVRPRVRVLNGTDDLDAARRVAPGLPPTGVAVIIVGNATSLDHETTTIAYVGPEQEEAAEAIRDHLGVGEVVVDPRPSDVVDITVTLGPDHD